MPCTSMLGGSEQAISGKSFSLMRPWREAPLGCASLREAQSRSCATSRASRAISVVQRGCSFGHSRALPLLDLSFYAKAGGVQSWTALLAEPEELIPFVPFNAELSLDVQLAVWSLSNKWNKILSPHRPVCATGWHGRGRSRGQVDPA